MTTIALLKLSPSNWQSAVSAMTPAELEEKRRELGTMATMYSSIASYVRGRGLACSAARLRDVERMSGQAAILVAVLGVALRAAGRL